MQMTFRWFGRSDPVRLEAIRQIPGVSGVVSALHDVPVRVTGARSFHETPHPTACGDVDVLAVLGALHETGFDGPMRPDHGRMIWGERGRPGYGLCDRALGAMYLYGMWEAIARTDAHGRERDRFHQL